jgi:squalene synthase HpnC
MNPAPHDSPAAAPEAAPDAPLTQAVGHYENFPVASYLCPARLRPAVMALYHFARTADDMADEGDAPALARLAELARYREALDACVRRSKSQEAVAEAASAAAAQHLPAQPVPPGPAVQEAQTAWPAIFTPLCTALREHHLPAQHLHDLISAFEQDVRHTANGHRYADMGELLAYTRLSAQPVGRLLLHLYGVHDDLSLRQSDQICSALQLINFWQDIRIDLARQRWYLPQDVLRRHGANEAQFLPDAPLPDHAARAVVGELCAHARGLMMQGAPLAPRVPGRAGWELRLVVQGGLHILDGIAAIEHRSWRSRPRLHRSDLPRLVWRALWM